MPQVGVYLSNPDNSSTQYSMPPIPCFATNTRAHCGKQDRKITLCCIEGLATCSNGKHLLCSDLKVLPKLRNKTQVTSRDGVVNSLVNWDSVAMNVLQEVDVEEWLDHDFLDDANTLKYLANLPLSNAWVVRTSESVAFVCKMLGTEVSEHTNKMPGSTQ